MKLHDSIAELDVEGKVGFDIIILKVVNVHANASENENAGIPRLERTRLGRSIIFLFPETNVFSSRSYSHGLEAKGY